jgi:L-threonylcarbamoyladenylate synthase
LAAEVPPLAEPLIERFMPGALTLVFAKKPAVPDVATGGLRTVAVRMPSHPAALRLIEKSGVPICAPSANRSTAPSATSARHVFDDFGGKIGYILDGGDCEIGLESTVVDVTGDIPRVLRAGGVTVEELEEAAGCVGLCADSSVALAPGMKYKHYAPKAAVYFSAFRDKMHLNAAACYDRITAAGGNAVIIALAGSKKLYGDRNVFDAGADCRGYAHNLFALLRRADGEGYGAVIAEGVADGGIGAAIINRLVKSSGGQII